MLLLHHYVHLLLNGLLSIIGKLLRLSLELVSLSLAIPADVTT